MGSQSFDSVEQGQSTSELSEVDIAISESPKESIEASCGSPLKMKKVSARDKFGYLKRKLSETTQNLTSKASKLTKVSIEEISRERYEAQETCKKCLDMDILVKEQKCKFKTSSRKMKIQNLILVPQS